MIYFDVTRLIDRLILKQTLPTGIDRILLAYFTKFPDLKGSLLQVGPYNRILSDQTTKTLQQIFTSPAKITRSNLLRLLVSEMRAANNKSKPTKLWALNFGHNGLHRQSYFDWIVKS